MLTTARLKESLSYDPETGSFTWLIQKARRTKIGSVAGTIWDGYIRIEIDNRSYRAHRLAWLYMTGVWPDEEIDHKNTNRSDNRWSNLRAATHSQNQGNARRRRDNSTGFKSVQKIRGKFRAVISRGPRIHLGYFDTAEKAHAAYCAAAVKLYGQFARTE